MQTHRHRNDCHEERSSHIPRNRKQEGHATQEHMGKHVD